MCHSICIIYFLLLPKVSSVAGAVSSPVYYPSPMERDVASPLFEGGERLQTGVSAFRNGRVRLPEPGSLLAGERLLKQQAVAPASRRSSFLRRRKTARLGEPNRRNKFAYSRRVGCSAELPKYKVYSHSKAPAHHSYTKPIVKINKNRKIIQKAIISI